VKLSRRTQFIIIGALSAVLVGLLVNLLVLRSHKPAAAAQPVVHHTVVASTHARATKPVARAQKHASSLIDPTLPSVLRTALARHAVVVAVLYAPGVPGDSDAVDAARAGAEHAHAGFAELNVRDEAVAAALATKLPGSSDPSVLVVRRPGKIALLINGYIDGALVSQAARVAQ
jgi:hypothetical protein